MWAMWFARSLDLTLTPDTVTAVSIVDEDLVALTALHLNSEGLAPALNTNLWDQYASKDHLYSDHWLIAYEANNKRWLGANAPDYIGQDKFYSILRNHKVSFYQVAASGAPQETGYEDDLLELAVRFPSVSIGP